MKEGDSTGPSTSEIPEPAAPRASLPSEARSRSLIITFVLAFIFGAFAFIPFVGEVLIYPSLALSNSNGFLNRTPGGDLLQILYELLLLEIAYLVGRRISFVKEDGWLFLPGFVGAALGLFLGVPGMQTTIVSGGIFLFVSNVFENTHATSALFNAPSLMGFVVAGIALAYVVRARTGNALGAQELTSNAVLIEIFIVGALFTFLGYMMPPILFQVFSIVTGPGSATSGIPYSVTVNSAVIANPLLFFVALFILGRRVSLVRDATTLWMILFIATLVASVAGNPIGSYFTGLVSTGRGTIPNYLANTTIFGTFMTAALTVAFAGAFLGFAAISAAVVRATRK